MGFTNKSIPGPAGPAGPIGPIGVTGPQGKTYELSEIEPHVTNAIDSAIGHEYDILAMYQLST